MLGYLVGGVAGGFLVYLLSSNMHDLSVEAPMTGDVRDGSAGRLPRVHRRVHSGEAVTGESKRGADCVSFLSGGSPLTRV
jgi:hypothetical protein